MGLFDSLKKFGEDLGKEIEKGVNSDAFKDIKNAVESAANNVSNEINSISGTNSNSGSTNGKEIPAKYAEFPKFRDTAQELKTIETDKYERCSMDYYNATEQEISEYVSKIISLGYVKGSNVRYDKGNTYIIVDDEKGYLNLVFHIKR